jgi:hypothetical protein
MTTLKKTHRKLSPAMKAQSEAAKKAWKAKVDGKIVGVKPKASFKDTLQNPKYQAYRRSLLKATK